MARIGKGWMGRALAAASLRRWTAAARDAGSTDLRVLRRQRAAARKLKARLDTLLFIADSRLSLPLPGTQAFPRPQDADWAWRPELWRGPLPERGLSSVPDKATLGTDATLFHDCTRSEITLRQTRNLRAADLAAYGLRLDVFSFDGSYLSLVIDLPPEAAQGLKRTHLIRIDTVVEMEQPLEILARLNIRHGPNTEQIVRELPLHDQEIRVEFDLAYTRLNEKRADRMWLDLIFERPQMNKVTLRDLTFARRPRADL